MAGTCNRRDFTKAALASAAAVSMPAVARAGRVIGANDRVRLGCIGVGYRGVQVLFAFGAHKDAEIASLCDVYEPYLNGQFDKIHPHFKKLGYVVPSRLPDFERPPQRHTDFRRVLDQKDLDAVIIATPDHWHAVHTIMACDAGKDVYIEKPFSYTIREGRRMVEAAHRTERGGAGWNPAPVVEVVCRARRPGSIGCHWQGHRGPGRPDGQHGAGRHRQGARLGPAARP